MPDSQTPSPPTFLSVFSSAVAAMFGVQSSKNHSRDFTHGKPIHYVVVGLIVTVLFILAVWGLVKFALNLADV